MRSSSIIEITMSRIQDGAGEISKWWRLLRQTSDDNAIVWGTKCDHRQKAIVCEIIKNSEIPSKELEKNTEIRKHKTISYIERKTLNETWTVNNEPFFDKISLFCHSAQAIFEKWTE